MFDSSITYAILIGMLCHEVAKNLLAIKILRTKTFLSFYRCCCIIELNPYITLVVLLYKYLLNNTKLCAHIQYVLL
jgi:hypothetical protein